MHMALLKWKSARFGFDEAHAGHIRLSVGLSMTRPKDGGPTPHVCTSSDGLRVELRTETQKAAEEQFEVMVRDRLVRALAAFGA
jgi:hypothetical protein